MWYVTNLGETKGGLNPMPELELEVRAEVQEVRHSETVSPAGRTWSYSDTETGSCWKFTEI